jgi:iron complex outermembrane receptor protein
MKHHTLETSGTDSFQGNTPEFQAKFNRYNLGVYLDVALDITEDLLVNGTGYEDYSDFGSATVWKASTRYKFSDDKVTLRASVSTGFRAFFTPNYTQSNLLLFQDKALLFRSDD